MYFFHYTICVRVFSSLLQQWMENGFFFLFCLQNTSLNSTVTYHFRDFCVFRKVKINSRRIKEGYLFYAVLVGGEGSVSLLLFLLSHDVLFENHPLKGLRGFYLYCVCLSKAFFSSRFPFFLIKWTQLVSITRKRIIS